ncbi:MAG: hypothetical protein ABTQ26_04310, partial [Azonexus sp.]
PAESVWTSLRSGDLIALPANSAHIAALPDSAKTKVLLEFDPSLPAAQIAAQMRQLEAAGFRQFGLSGFPVQGMNQIGPILSLRSQPQLK